MDIHYFGYAGLLQIILAIIFIGISWWALQTLRFDVFTFHPKGAQAKALQILLAIVIGYETTKFFIDYLGWSMTLKGLF